MHSKQRLLANLLLVLLSSSWGLTATANPSWQWRPVQPGKRKGISGLAFVKQQAGMCQFLAVHDNKGDLDQPRLALLGVPSKGPVRYQSLPWPQDQTLPLDLEALTVMPNTRHTEYVAVTSLGLVYHLQFNLETKAVTVLRTVQIPPHTKPINIEGFALHSVNGQLVAVWAHRGIETEPAILFWGTYHPEKAKIVPGGSTSIQVPWPLEDVRHISDLKIAPNGLLYITAASDPGDQGPFQSATYIVESISALSSRAKQPQVQDHSTLVPIYRFHFNKVEALELIPGNTGGIVLASDDEKFGSALAGTCFTEPKE